MEILNTYTTPTDFSIAIGIILGLLGAVFLAAAITSDDAISAILGGIAGGVLIVFAILLITSEGETRHEVILREPSGLNGEKPIIDGAKYRVIEQRGEIYVIEERNSAKEGAE